MSDASERILVRLKEAGFQIRRGGLAPFGEELALVAGCAWDERTAQLAVVADGEVSGAEEQWRQLLFACSGLRHHLAADTRTAFGTPVILAVVDAYGERAMRELVEDLLRRYAVFNRVDLNLVRREDTAAEESLDTAMAPLLPCCRRMLGSEISRRDVIHFWDVLREEVKDAARGLDKRFGEYRQAAGDALAELLVGDSASAGELPAPHAIHTVEIEHFRSFTHADVEFTQATVLHGANGSGKSTVLEALDLLWASTSQRKPAYASATEYARHLPHNGAGEFAIRSAGQTVSSVDNEPRAQLERCVLTQDFVTALANSSPAERYERLLTITGLEIPDLDPRTKRILTSAKQAADEALGAAGLPRLPSTNTAALAFLDRELGSVFARRLPPVDELRAVEEALALASEGSYRPQSWGDERRALDAAIRADAAVAETVARPGGDGESIGALDSAAAVMRELAETRHAAARAARALLEALERSQAQVPARTAPQTRRAPVPPELAVRWLANADSSQAAARRLAEDASVLKDPEWRARLEAYAEALEAVSRTTPRKELEQWTRTKALPAAVRPAEPVAAELFTATGFSAPPVRPTALPMHLRARIDRLHVHATALEGLAREMDTHPARRYREHAPRLLDAICRYELARAIRRKGPIAKAGEQLVGELLQSRLLPVVRELMAALVRFEWYFKPLQIPQTPGRLVFGGLATPQADLDASMTLNSAERSVLGVAWFLALHLMQPPERRRVLVLDDPTAAFDTTNQWSFVATVRAFVRLTRPEQVVISTHDDAVAATLADDLAPVNDWPQQVSRLRCARGPQDASIVTQEALVSDSHDTERELTLLGLAAGSLA
ncbi:MAG TPA: AAA family ATPase [Solirubrobacteraceae bacterium]|nr:AAA family ATPase [Solirubrobacteraceae bacterium]